MLHILLWLGLVGSPAPQPERVHGWINDLVSADATARAAARAELVKMGPAVIPDMMRAYVRANLPLKEAMGPVVAQMGVPAVEALYETSLGSLIAGLHEKFSMGSVELAAKVGEAAVPTARAMAMEGGYEAAGRRMFGRGILVRLGEPGANALVDALQSPDELVRRQAVSLLAPMRYRSVGVRLREYTRDRDFVVRAYAIAGASAAPDPELVELMFRGVADENSLVRQICITGLGDHYEPRFRRALAESVRSDSNRLVRNVASRALVSQTSDPLAQRLGRRYFSQPLLLIEDYAKTFRSYAAQMGTALVLLLMVAGAFRAAGGEGRATFQGVALAVAGVLGIWWGGLARGVTGSEENSLLFVVLPISVVFGYLLRYKTRRVPEGARALRGATLRVFGAFYVAFGLGFAWVWGFLGF